MHPFCCATSVSVSPTAAAAAAASSSSSSSSMPPPEAAAAASISSHKQQNGTQCPSVPAGDHAAHHLQRPDAPSSSSVTTAFAAALSRTASIHESILLHGGSAGEAVKINDIVGNGICGILHKWVNYGKGWRPRWFVLQDGVLSYYKIHGPDRIEITPETEKGSKLIGEESQRWIFHHQHRKHIGHQNYIPPPRKPVGEVHLKVSSIRESKSDEKRFSIFTGTKRLHLRADTREDCVAWIEALQAIKEMFPRISNSELMAPLDNVSVSTEKLRQRLQEEGVSEAAIQDSEQIMRTEFAALQNQLMLLKQKQARLIDTLRQLEVISPTSIAYLTYAIPKC